MLVLEDSRVSAANVELAQPFLSTIDSKKDVTVLKDILSAQDSVSQKLMPPEKPLHLPYYQDFVKTKTHSK